MNITDADYKVVKAMSEISAQNYSKRPKNSSQSSQNFKKQESCKEFSSFLKKAMEKYQK